MPKIILTSYIIAAIGLIFAVISVFFLEKKEAKNDKQDKFLKIFQKGAGRFTKENSQLAIVAEIIIALLIAGSSLGFKNAAFFIAGAISAILISKIAIGVLNIAIKKSGESRNFINGASITFVLLFSFSALAMAVSYELGSIKLVLPFLLG
ncbi:MAG: hypothetical protein V1698_00160, partial [bacterium]